MSYKDTYKLWYEFLKRTDCESWSEKVKQDFGGVLEKDFATWWDFNLRCSLFSPYGPMVGPNKVNWMKNQPVRRVFEGQNVVDVDHNTHFILVIDRRHPYTDTMELIEKRVKRATEEGWADTIDDPNREETKRKTGRKEWKPSLALYPFASRPDPEALELTLLIHDIDRDHKTDEAWTHWETGVEAKKLNPKFQQNMKYGKNGPDAEQKIQITSAVTRILERAEKIKAGVVQGIFPAV